KRVARIGFEHHIRWFDVSMHHTAGFSCGESACRLLDYVQRDGEGHRPVATHTSFQRFALDQFHRVETLTILLPIISHPRDVGMMNIRSRTCFAKKTGTSARILR